MEVDRFGTSVGLCADCPRSCPCRSAHCTVCPGYISFGRARVRWGQGWTGTSTGAVEAVFIMCLNCPPLPVKMEHIMGQ